jgi:predicted peptidase
MRKIVTIWALSFFSMSLGAAMAQTGTPSPKLAPDPKGPQYQMKGDQYRVYNFPVTGESLPYRLYIPSKWDKNAKLPLLVALRAGNSVDNPYQRGDGALIKFAEQRGYIVVTPMGYRPDAQPYYGSPYQIARPGAAAPAAGWTAQANERAEQDVLNVIDLVSAEYNVDRNRIYLHGNNPAGSGVLYLAQKYPERFAAVAVSSAPIVMEKYPVERLKGVGLVVIHGDQDTTNPLDASRAMATSFKERGVDVEWMEVKGGSHQEAWTMVLPQILDFFDHHIKR